MTLYDPLHQESSSLKVECHHRHHHHCHYYRFVRRRLLAAAVRTLMPRTRTTIGRQDFAVSGLATWYKQPPCRTADFNSVHQDIRKKTLRLLVPRRILFNWHYVNIHIHSSLRCQHFCYWWDLEAFDVMSPAHMQ